MKNIAEERILAARKTHQCNWCNQTIAVGEAYERQRNVDGSDVWVWRAHAECAAAAWRLSNDDLECSAGVQFTRGCSCEAGQHDDDSPWSCDETPLTQAEVAAKWRADRAGGGS